MKRTRWTITPKAPFVWTALFRDGHAIEQGGNHEEALNRLVWYLHGDPHELTRRSHYLIWFKLYDKDNTDMLTVNFDPDGDAYISLIGGHFIMTEHKMRSAELLYRIMYNKLFIGFGGLNSLGKLDAKVVVVNPNTSIKQARTATLLYDKLKV